MVTYPSTHGVFEEGIVEEVLATLGHDHAGGQVYIDGANLNAMVGVCQLRVNLVRDVSHLKSSQDLLLFPHGGGGPGVGPVAC